MILYNHDINNIMPYRYSFLHNQILSSFVWFKFTFYYCVNLITIDVVDTLYFFKWVAIYYELYTLGVGGLAGNDQVMWKY